MGEQPSDATDQLQGPVRKITDEFIAGISRAGSADQSGQIDLPKAVSILVADDQIRVVREAAPEAAAVVERSSRGEVFRLSGAEEMLASNTRALGGNAPVAEVASVAASPAGLDQLLGISGFRGTSLATPFPNARLLSGKITFRRRTSEEEPTDGRIEIREHNSAILSFSLDAKRSTVRWSEIPDLPEDLKDGLPPGEYSVIVDNESAGTFVVEDEELAEWVDEPVLNLSAISSVDGNLVNLYRIEHWLSQVDEEGLPSPYLCDALDLIESLPDEWPYKQRRSSWVLARLGQKPGAVNDESAVGIASIDTARGLIRTGRWSDAREALTTALESADARTQQMAKLYSAVIDGESTIGQVFRGDAARDSFRAALRDMEKASPSDRYRAHVNFGNYLCNKTQSRVYNYTLQSAAKLDSPLLSILVYWDEAQKQYDAADKCLKESSEGVSPDDLAALSLNRARLYATISDLARNLDRDGERLRELFQTCNRQSEPLCIGGT